MKVPFTAVDWTAAKLPKVYVYVSKGAKKREGNGEKEKKKTNRTVGAANHPKTSPREERQQEYLLIVCVCLGVALTVVIAHESLVTVRHMARWQVCATRGQLIRNNA